MKKKFNQKLVLNKKTVANLEEREMKEARGGNDYTYVTCDAACETISCDTLCFNPLSCCVCITAPPIC